MSEQGRQLEKEAVLWVEGLMFAGLLSSGSVQDKRGKKGGGGGEEGSHTNPAPRNILQTHLREAWNKNSVRVAPAHVASCCCLCIKVVQLLLLLLLCSSSIVVDSAGRCPLLVGLMCLCLDTVVGHPEWGIHRRRTTLLVNRVRAHARRAWEPARDGL